MGFAAGSAAAFYFSPRYGGASYAGLLIAAAACIQLRLLCNLLDGMLAVEEGLKSATGELFNDLPDRFSDIVILVGAGYAIQQLSFGAALGWSAAVAALLTAYVRVLGGAIGVTQHFIGPMAKQHRMFTLTMAALCAALENAFDARPRAIALGLALIVAGSLLTAVRRLGRVVREVEAR
jgi:phosphatidylglycerophosphate synthase